MRRLEGQAPCCQEEKRTWDLVVVLVVKQTAGHQEGGWSFKYFFVFLKHIALLTIYCLPQIFISVDQCVAIIWIFEYIRIFIDKYIHSLKYSCIFPKWIYSNDHLRLFSPHEYNRTLIGYVRFQRVHWFEADQQNKNCYLKKT